jgi:acetylornithine/succinyldiaminopimelate/putrescine aminotransferase
VGDALAAQLKKGQLGTTFGGGPLACALVEATLQAIEEDRVLERVRRVSQRIFESCRAGPVESIQGLGLLIGLKCTRPAKEILAELRQRGILAGSSHDPRVVRLLPPLVIEEAQVAQLSAALKEIAR